MDWVNRTLFPFPVNEFTTPAGVMRYVDIGHGPVVLFAHGTPTWSLLWRHAMAKLASNYRVIAVDHLGFGQSDKPADADYTLAGHAQRWSALIDHLLQTGDHDTLSRVVGEEFGRDLLGDDALNAARLMAAFVRRLHADTSFVPR